MGVCNQTKPYTIFLSVNLLFMVCVKTVTNDTVKATGFVTVRSQMKAHFCTEYWITSTTFWRMQNTLQLSHSDPFLSVTKVQGNYNSLTAKKRYSNKARCCATEIKT
jgi:hypothetical protein